MGLVIPLLSLLVKISLIASSLLLQGSAGRSIAISPATSSSISPSKEGSRNVAHGKLVGSHAPSPSSRPNGSSLHPPLVSSPYKPALVPKSSKGPTPQPPPSTAPPSVISQAIAPSLAPSAPEGKPLHHKAPVLVPEAPAPVASPTRELPPNPPPFHPHLPGSIPPTSYQNKTGRAPVSAPIAPAQIAPGPSKALQGPSTIHPIAPEVPTSILPAAAPIASPPTVLPVNSTHLPQALPKEPPSDIPVPNLSPTSTPPPSHDWKRERIPLAAPPKGMSDRHSPYKPSPTQSPSVHEAVRHSHGALPPVSFHESPPHPRFHSSAPLPSATRYRHHHASKSVTIPASLPLPVPPIVSTPTGHTFPVPPLHPPSSDPRSNQRILTPPPLYSGSSVSSSHSPFPKSLSHVSPAPSASLASPSGQTEMPLLSPTISPSGSSPRMQKTPFLPAIQALPPPPPNGDCTSVTCTEPLTNTPPGSPCGCVRPMQVGLRLGVALYTFFPLVSELAVEIAAGVFLKQSQVRIMGANAASQDPEKTIVLIDLVPLGEKFDNTTAYLTYHRFWHKQVAINPSFFGDYDVLYVRYPGLPSSPPSASSGDVIGSDPYISPDNNGRTIQPLGVDVPKQQHKDKINGSLIAVIALSASVALILCCAVAWVFLFKQRHHREHQAEPTPPTTLPSLTKSSGIAASIIGSGPSSSLSFTSSFATYSGTAKTFGASDIEKATDNFNPSRILGEGGFGRVYSGVLEDGTAVAVKVLKRDDHQGGRQFLAEVEMLSRLHHRNLVKLIGICTEEHARCLVYELIPNGSVESHIHGIDKETAPLDWSARIKIALGAARGLAYLHEDSNPRVIHRDFKSSNILLERDYTPKVSDFGLARTAMEEENRHISTRVMGTFGYVAPEYAMTGHLLVKSDVYSYGVVLLELLTGRKPVDMSQPPGQENLVAWTRPLLTSREGLESIVDRTLGPDLPYDSIVKVATIASMCVQPEVSHRPFMGEVVQALKLVCNECEETQGLGSRCCSQEDLSIDLDAGNSTNSGHLLDPLRAHSPVSTYGSALDADRGPSVSGFFSTSPRFRIQDSGSLRRQVSSGPLRIGRGRPIWQRLRRLSGGTVSEHRAFFRFWAGSY